MLYVPEKLKTDEDFISFCYSNNIECGELVKTQKFDTSKHAHTHVAIGCKFE